MRLIGRRVLAEFAARHASVRAAVEAWACEVAEADWNMPADLKARYPSASFIAGNRVVFNIKGNSYRIEVKISYEIKTVLVLRAGTHAQYTKWKT